MGNPIRVLYKNEEVTVYSQAACDILLAKGATRFVAPAKPIVEPEPEIPALPDDVFEIIKDQLLPVSAWSREDLNKIAKLYGWRGWHMMKTETLSKKVHGALNDSGYSYIL